MGEKNVIVSTIGHKCMDEKRVEIVERKGLGHPDYIADAIAEAVSRELCRYYTENFGTILHHNVDKVLVVGGQADPRFGGGEVLHPIYIIIAGRATTHVETERGVRYVPIGPLVLRAARDWLRKNFRYLDPDEHVIVDYRIGKGSVDLTTLYKAGLEGGYPKANDTSVGVSYAPLSQTERVVLEVERRLNSREVKERLPAVGEDVKVMAVRVGDRIDLTIAAAIISREVHNLEEYLDVKERIREVALDVARSVTDREVVVHVNTADMIEKAYEGGVYLTVTGTSAEHGDDGATGRGNRVNGLITPFRPMSLEAAAGKNPVSHVGKIYNVLASRIAERVAGIEGVKEAYVELLSQIGRSINDPLLASVNLVVERGLPDNDLRHEVTAIVEEELDRVTDLKDLILSGNVMLF